MVIKVKITDKMKEKYFPGGLEAWKKGQEMVDNLISQQKIEPDSQQKIEPDFQKAIKEKKEKRLKKHAKRMRELRSEGFTMEKIDRFEEDE